MFSKLAWFITVLGMALCNIAEAQQPTVPHIGYISASAASEMLPRTQAFRGGLRKLGYVEGKNIFIQLLYGEGKFDRVPGLIAELVRLNVAVIVTGGPAVTQRAKEATAKIPIVMTNDSDPVGSGFVASLARPGGNITGLTSLNHSTQRSGAGGQSNTVIEKDRVRSLPLIFFIWVCRPWLR